MPLYNFALNPRFNLQITDLVFFLTWYPFTQNQAGQFVFISYSD